MREESRWEWLESPKQLGNLSNVLDRTWTGSARARMAMFVRSAELQAEDDFFLFKSSSVAQDPPFLVCLKRIDRYDQPNGHLTRNNTEPMFGFVRGFQRYAAV
jgi:hypothetical protein